MPKQLEAPAELRLLVGNEFGVKQVTEQVTHLEDGQLMVAADRLRALLNSVHDDSLSGNVQLILPANNPVRRTPLQDCEFYGGRAKINAVEHQLYLDEKPVHLARMPLLLINLLGNSAGEVVPYEALKRKIWGHGKISNDTLRGLKSSVIRATEPGIVLTRYKAGYFTPK